MSLITVAYPESWLSWTISVVNMTTEVEDFSGAMVEVGTTKLYKYEFTEVAWESYVFTVSFPWYDDYVDSIIYEVSGSGGWLTTEEHDKLMNITGGWGWYVRTWLDAIDKKYLKETHEKVLTLVNTDISWIENTLNETNSHIDIAKESIIDTIKQESIEVSSDIIRKSKELETSNVKTRNLVRQKTEKIDKNVSKLSDRQDKTDEMIEREADEIEEELEQIFEKEADMIENEIIAQFEKEADDIESNLS